MQLDLAMFGGSLTSPKRMEEVGIVILSNDNHNNNSDAVFSIFMILTPMPISDDHDIDLGIETISDDQNIDSDAIFPMIIILTLMPIMPMMPMIMILTLMPMILSPDPEGAFLIPYAIALATLGLPLFILELAVSHSDSYSHSDTLP